MPMPPLPTSRMMRKSPTCSSAGDVQTGLLLGFVLVVFLDLLDLDHRREQLVNLVRQLGIAVDILLAGPAVRRRDSARQTRRRAG